MYFPPSTKPLGTTRYLEAVTVSVEYSDFLSEFLIHNRLFFDKLVVVTSTKDLKTQQLCEVYDVECVVTDTFYDDESVFNKGKGINKGLARLSNKGWVLHIDADVILPPYFRTVFNNIYLDEEAIYGCDRLNVVGKYNWLTFLENPKPMHQHYFLVHGGSFPIGARVAHYNQQDGWFPIGFFQLFNPHSSGIVRYPEECTGADHSDVVFAKAFPLEKRRFIPEFYVYHLESEHCEIGANWKGRRTKRFTIDEDI